ncbi:hypothetical protein G9C98_004303 [Cotesia typhae]|uniref:Uncharacterized protein n=1 Tax=Cotesia typhae TaxID=2053667 RepID=A0A8J5R796_9HYME|nr:hypothetical protein G9C98_004303 [Cotesia typhae]
MRKATTSKGTGAVTENGGASLKYELNPGCGRVCDEKSLTTLHLKAEGPNDTLHYLWDFVGNPSVLLAIIEFNDVYDKATIDNVRNEDINILNPEYFNWTRKNSIKSNQFVELDMIGQNYTDPELNNITRAGNIEIILNGFCTLEHSDVIPHMLHSENSTQIDFIINHLRTNSSFNKSRFGLELMVVSEGDSSSRMSIDTKKSLDDEYTPGIFEDIPRWLRKSTRRTIFVLGDLNNIHRSRFTGINNVNCWHLYLHPEITQKRVQ